MVKEAEAHAEEDRRRKELVEARNQADSAIYSVEKALKEAEGRVPQPVRSEVEQAITSVREATQREDVQRIRQSVERLTQVASRLNEAARPGAASSAEPKNDAGDQDVVDADFEEVDKRNRNAG
jgi:molecular chaperone DnaK